MATAYEEMVAEFNLRVNKELYKKGEELVSKRINEELDYPTYYEFDEEIEWKRFDRYNDIEEDIARWAFEDDGGTPIGNLTVPEVYFLIAEHFTLDDANEYLEDIDYYETEAVA